MQGFFANSKTNIWSSWSTSGNVSKMEVTTIWPITPVSIYQSVRPSPGQSTFLLPQNLANLVLNGTNFLLFDSDPVHKVQNKGETTLREEEHGIDAFNSKICISRTLEMALVQSWSSPVQDSSSCIS